MTEEKDLAMDSPPAQAGSGAGGGTPVHPGRSPSPILTFIFALVPGAAHMYMGLTQKGIQLMVLFFGSLYLSQHLFFLRDFWPLVVAPATWFYSFFNALETARRLGQNEPVEDRPIIVMDRLLQRAPLWGWILIVLGGITLLERFLSMTVGMFGLRRYLAPLVVPLVITACGVYLLMQQRPRPVDATPAPSEHAGPEGPESDGPESDGPESDEGEEVG